VDEKDKCKKCMGKKVSEVKTTLEVAVEPGCPNEHSYIFHGMADEQPGVMAGDVHVRIFIEKHKEFTRKGADLFVEK
jgi:DnaJ family protein A protein 2